MCTVVVVLLLADGERCWSTPTLVVVASLSEEASNVSLPFCFCFMVSTPSEEAPTAGCCWWRPVAVASVGPVSVMASGNKNTTSKMIVVVVVALANIAVDGKPTIRWLSSLLLLLLSLLLTLLLVLPFACSNSLQLSDITLLNSCLFDLLMSCDSFG